MRERPKQRDPVEDKNPGRQREQSRIEGLENVSLEELKVKVEEMAKYWKAGFGNYVAAIATFVGPYAKYKKGRNEIYQHSEKLLSEIEGLYSKIPFSELNKEAYEFKPLFKIDGLIPELRNKCNKFWGGPTESLSKEIFLIGKHIVNLGRLYDTYAQRLVHEIRKSPGNEDYKVKVYHITGEEKKYSKGRYIDGSYFSEEHLTDRLKDAEKSRKELDEFRKKR